MAMDCAICTIAIIIWCDAHTSESRFKKSCDHDGGGLPMKKNRGFTLIEIIVALFIFAIVGVLAAMSLNTMIRAHKRLDVADSHLLQLEISMTMMRRDIAQIIDRPT